MRTENNSYNISINMLIVGLILFIVVITGVSANNLVKQEKISSDLLQAKTVVVEFDKEKQRLEQEVQKLKDDIKKFETLAHIKKEFSLLKKENRSLILSLSFTESSWKKDVVHNEWNTEGECGIRPYFWGKLLEEKGIPINSLRACEAVYEFLLKENNGNKLEALKDYKGAKTNFASAKKVLELENKINKKGLLDDLL